MHRIKLWKKKFWEYIYSVELNFFYSSIISSNNTIIIDGIHINHIKWFWYSDERDGL